MLEDLIGKIHNKNIARKRIYNNNGLFNNNQILNENTSENDR
jgi:hypothetical protein